ncbi:uracil-DNA glycosylase [Cryptosporangium phraense]|uniref:Uracil-DNA glycosylase n=1 Tax=Cryptosporangium phraense TaxID=2593070 RepID=A0A545AHG7_9ACTN|nr:uracil-DNA glycosylase [Cryptosporangium phraense]TQS40761.1 uracil-DNA glycosylase [Cryptosporangium phraense]
MPLDLIALLPEPWREVLDLGDLTELETFVEREYAEQTVYPPLEDLFAAFRLCPPEQVRVLLLGQDPYHGPGQAHGLCFSVRAGTRVPPSLRNVFKEMAADVGSPMPGSGALTAWAEQGVLLLNSVLTVRKGQAGSHANRGWEEFTDATIRAVNRLDHRVVYLLWGSYARKKAALVTNPAHVVLEAGHPSPMNPRGFLGSRPFSATNKALADAGLPEITWDLKE